MDFSDGFWTQYDYFVLSDSFVFISNDLEEQKICILFLAEGGQMPLVMSNFDSGSLYAHYLYPKQYS